MSTQGRWNIWSKTILIIGIPTAILAALFWGLPIDICKKQIAAQLFTNSTSFYNMRADGWTGGPLALMKNYSMAFSYDQPFEFADNEKCTFREPQDYDLANSKRTLIMAFPQEREAIDLLAKEDMRIRTYSPDPYRQELAQTHTLLVSRDRKRGYYTFSMLAIAGGF